MIYRCILPEWAKEEYSEKPKVIEGQFTNEEIETINSDLFNVYFLPNYPSVYAAGTTVDGSQIDKFEWVYVDMDLKDKIYATKEDFLEKLFKFDIVPTKIVDSGNGIHAYWRVSDLDAMNHLRLQRRLIRYFNTDESVAKIYQLMRVPGTINTKHKNDFKVCEILLESNSTYSCEQLDKVLPVITEADESYCKNHYNKTYKINTGEIKIEDKLPTRFSKLLRQNSEVKQLFSGDTSDRSKADYRLAHILNAEGYTREEAMSVLVNCRKALERSDPNRYSYALNIVDKIWVFEETGEEELLSNSVKEILKKGAVKGAKRFKCWDVFDGTQHGFRLTEILGLIGGAGSGKTTLALNYFYHFTKANPDYIHLFVSLEQPEEEIAARWFRMTEGQEHLHDKVHVLGNYDKDGSYRNLSLFEIEEYVLKLEKKLSVKVGCVVIDHIGVLKKKGKDGENQGLIEICHYMKAFAKKTNTFLVMQSQTSRPKAGIGDQELDKDAAYGTSMFEWYCDYVVTTWQPLKRVYARNTKMTCSAFKYGKIRHKNVLKDSLKEDNVYILMFNPNTELLREMTEAEKKVYDHLEEHANRLRNRDKKREPTKVSQIDWTNKKDDNESKTDNNTH